MLQDNTTYPIPIISGSQPCTLYPASLANGFKPCSFTASSDAKMIDPAPSQIPEALAAVTTPSFLKTGLSVDIFSRDVSGRGCSSVSITYLCISYSHETGIHTRRANVNKVQLTLVPFFVVISTLAISKSNTPFFFASPQVC